MTEKVQINFILFKLFFIVLNLGLTAGAILVPYFAFVIILIPHLRDNIFSLLSLYKLIRKKKPIVDIQLEPIDVFIPVHNETKETYEHCMKTIASNYPASNMYVIKENPSDEIWSNKNQDNIYEITYNDDHHAKYKVTQSGVFAEKEKRAGKKDSLLLFGAFTRRNKEHPYMFLTDADSKLSKNALRELVHYMNNHPNVMAAGGMIRPTIKWCNPLVCIQYYQYVFSQYIRKQGENIATKGRVTCLPGPITIIRRSMLEKVEKEYIQVTDTMNPFIYAHERLGSDRRFTTVLTNACDSEQNIIYLSNASADTDTPDTLMKLLRQRRRWWSNSISGHIINTMNSKQRIVSRIHSALEVFRIMTIYARVAGTIIFIYMIIKNAHDYPFNTFTIITIILYLIPAVVTLINVIVRKQENLCYFLTGLLLTKVFGIFISLMINTYALFFYGNLTW